MNDESTKYEAAGKPIEVGLVNFLVDNKIPVHESFAYREAEYPLMLMIPFSHFTKRMLVAYKISANTIRVVVKGAPEMVIPLCDTELDGNNQ
jgi:magnesium-transporting ATPase (P-type)